jgi:predicted alpha/beta-fold hydrolase
MPLIESSSYIRPHPLCGRHFQTVFPTCFRHIAVPYERERIDTPDGDFLDIDWTRSGSRQVVVLIHGLEGSTRSNYIRGMTRAFRHHGWDTAALNLRGCSGVPNRLLRSYHSGASEDLQCTLNHILRRYDYDTVGLLGFSLGGNLMLKFLGEQGKALDSRVRGAVAFSVPCDLKECSERMALSENSFYMLRFLKLLKIKMAQKGRLFPGQVSLENYDSMRSFREFDDRYTAPMHGFRDAEEYWRLCSARAFIDTIAVPTLLVSALDDPFLSPACYPSEQAKHNACFFLETPNHGGHTGFVRFRRDGLYWSEARALHFLQSL